MLTGQRSTKVLGEGRGVDVFDRGGVSSGEYAIPRGSVSAVEQVNVISVIQRAHEPLMPRNSLSSADISNFFGRSSRVNGR